MVVYSQTYYKVKESSTQMRGPTHTQMNTPHNTYIYKHNIRALPKRHGGRKLGRGRKRKVVKQETGLRHSYFSKRKLETEVEPRPGFFVFVQVAVKTEVLVECQSLGP